MSTNPYQPPQDENAGRPTWPDARESSGFITSFARMVAVLVRIALLYFYMPK